MEKVKNENENESPTPLEGFTFENLQLAYFESKAALNNVPSLI